MSRKTVVQVVCTAVLLSVSAFAMDGVVLINQNTVMAAGGFPYHIRQSGSYKLSGNLSVTADTDAIDISADNVLLDLNGFTIAGAASGNNATSMGNGISSDNSQVTVINGQVTGFARGINLFGEAESVNRITATRNGEAVLILEGRIADSTAEHNNGDGFSVVDEGSVVHCRAAFNVAGIRIEIGLVSGNDLVANFFGIFVFDSVGYGSNTLLNNGTDVLGGTSMNNNVCSNGRLC